MERHNVPSNSAVPASLSQGLSQRLLILGCSKAKSTQPGLLPALQRYDGPAFRVLRRYLRLQKDVALRIYILSAEFGLIPAEQPIPNYDRRMTLERARALQSPVARTLQQILPPTWNPSSPPDVLVHLGRDYLPALDGINQADADLLQGSLATGSQGRKLSLLHDWLYGSPPPGPKRPRQSRQPQQFRSVALNVDREGVLEIARRDLQGEPRVATRFHTWYVEVNGQHIAPKWLVSQVTGLPVSGFTTTEARSLLARMGIEVKRA